MTELSLIRPDDWHLHVRDGEALKAVLPDTARRFGRAIIMPNLKPPVRTVTEAQAYRERILAARPPGSDFRPLMTLYLTDHTAPDEIVRAKESGFVHALKLYPAGATTNSEYGVTDLHKTLPALRMMATLGLPLLIHGEVTDTEVDIFDREAVFIERVLKPLLDQVPDLRVVFEHITTREAAEFVRTAPATVAATITAHHLLLNRNDLLAGGIRPHYYCLPILKREAHRAALIAAATSGNPKYFLGTDSAPHEKSTKEASCGCAGIYTAHAGIELYAEAFDQAGALDRLEDFASRFGPLFYGLPVNTDLIRLRREPIAVPTERDFPGGMLVPFRAGETLQWRLL
jgi:dihydroorotase